MPAFSVVVTLSDVLEVRGGPLSETEIWGVLCQGAEVLQDLFTAGQAINELGLSFVINPDTLGTCLDGQIQLEHGSKVQQCAKYLAPEMHEGSVFTETAYEKMYVYSLGKSLMYAAEYGLRTDQPLKIGQGLESLLRSMCNANPADRVPLAGVLQACSLHSKGQHMRTNYSQVVKSLYSTVLGTGGEENAHHGTYGSEQSRQSTLTSVSRSQRSPRKHKHSYRRERQNSRKHSPVQRTGRSRSRSQSRSHSRSRSRSGSRRTRPTGRDSPDSEYARGFVSSCTKTLADQMRHDKTQHPSQPNTSEPYSSSKPSNHPSHTQLVTLPHDLHSQAQSPISHSKPSIQPLTTSPIHEGQQGPPPRIAHHTMNTETESSAYQKYLRLRERQRKLRVLRLGLFEEEPDEGPVLTGDHSGVDARSVTSVVSYTQGVYVPDLHLRYGSNSALKMGLESDRESIVSSEVSYNQNTLRASGDYCDPFLQQLQQLTYHPPPVFQPQPTKSQSSVTRSHREFYGPEFVHRSSKPIIRIPVPLQGESRKNPGKVCRVVVVLLTGQKLEAFCDATTTGQQLFEAVVTHVELPEFFFFGLTYINDGEHFFIAADKKLNKVAPDGWKDGWKGPVSNVTFTVHLRVKFYMDNISALRHQTTKHLLYLQCRRDILEERCQCNEDHVVALAGLAMQAEYGDYNKETMDKNYFTPEHYFSGHALHRLGMGYIRDNTPVSHLENAGMSEVEAELQFIKMVQQLPEYGRHIYRLQKSKSNTNDLVWLGINAHELVVAETEGYNRVIVHHHPWTQTQKISFNKRRFSVQPKPEMGQVKPHKINYYTSSYRKGQYLLKFCTEQHGFLMKMRTRMAALDSQVLEPIADSSSIGGVDDMEASDGDDNVTVLEENSQKGSLSAVRPMPKGQSSKGHGPLVMYKNPPPFNPDSSVSMIDLPSSTAAVGHMWEVSRPLHGIYSATTGHLEMAGRKEKHCVDPPAYVLGVSATSMDQTASTPTNETISNTLIQRFDQELLSPEPPQSEQHIFEVTLEKEPHMGIGISIVGNDCTSKLDLGIFIKSVIVGGPAYRDGHIKAGDRLIAINGKSLEGVQHHSAVQMIKDSDPTVRLLISQAKLPGSLRRNEAYNEDFNLNKMRASHTSPNDVNIFVQNMRSRNLNSHPVIVVDKTNEEEERDVKEDAEVFINSLNSDNIPCHTADGQKVVSEDQIVREIDVNTSYAHSKKTVPTQIGKSSRVEESESETESEFDDSIQATVEGIMPHTELNRKVVCDDQAQPEVAEQLYTTYSKGGSECSQSSTDGKIFTVFLEKKNGSLGINVTGGVNTTVKHGGIYVKSLFPGGSAEDEGSIQRGDRILEVNDVSMIGMTHKQAVESLKYAPPLCKIVVERPGSASSRKSSHASHKSSTPSENSCSPAGSSWPSRSSEGDDISARMKKFEGASIQPSKGNSIEETIDSFLNQIIKEERTYKVILNKGSRGLGFSICGGRENSQPKHQVIRIKRVFPLSPAAESGQIQSGDIILRVGDVEMKGLSFTEALSVIRTAETPVQFILCRPAPDKLSPLPRVDSEISLYIHPMNPSTSSRGESDSSEEESPVPFREENLVSPPTGFNSPIYLKDEEGLIIPKPASPPPPLPTSPMPTLTIQYADSPTEDEEFNSDLLDSYKSEIEQIDVESFTDEIKGENLQNEDETSGGGGIEDEELHPDMLDSCRSEMERINVAQIVDEEEDRTLLENWEEGGRGGNDEAESRAQSKSSQSDQSVSSQSSILKSPLMDFLKSELYLPKMDSVTVTDSETESSQGLFIKKSGPPSGKVSQGEKQNQDDGDEESLTESNSYDPSITDTTSIGYRADNSDEEVEEKNNYEDDYEDSNNERTDHLDNGQNISQRTQGYSESIASRQKQDSLLQKGELEVTLTKSASGGGLGFTVVGGAATAGGIYIKGIVHDPALSYGILHPGDKLIKVNGIDMTSLSHFEAVNVLRDMPQVVKIRVYRDPRMNTEKLPKQDKNDAAEDDRDRNTGQISQKSEKYALKRSLDENQTESDDDDDSDNQSKKTDNKGPVLDPKTKETNNSVKMDRGSPKKGIDAVDHASKASPIGQGRQSPKASEMNLHHIDLEKPVSGGLGISLVTAEAENQTGIFIRSIAHGGVTDSDGRLKVGDKLLQINGESLVGLSHNKAAAILRNLQGKIILTVSRNSRNRLPVSSKDPEAEMQRTTSTIGTQQSSLNQGQTNVHGQRSEQGQKYVDSDHDSILSLNKHGVTDTLSGDEEWDSLASNAEHYLQESRSSLTSKQKSKSKIRDSHIIEADISFELPQIHLDDSCSISGTLIRDLEDSIEKTETKVEYVIYPDSTLIPKEIQKQSKSDKTLRDNIDSRQNTPKDKDTLNVSTLSERRNLSPSKFSDYRTSRKVDIEIPDKILRSWLHTLPLVAILADMKLSLQNLIGEIQEKMRNNDIFEEYNMLKKVQPTDDCSVAKQEENKNRNRFRNVLPYDENRVKVSMENDYINASHIRLDVISEKGNSTSCSYIACQGPLPQTTDSFWEMVWDNSVTVIIMLTRDMEARKVKCHRYWPDSPDDPAEVCSGRYRLNLLREDPLDEFDVRYIEMEDLVGGESRIVYHINYTTWPDHGLPHSAMPILQCIRLSHLLQRSGPLLVHCSAGIGRTGTFITVDVALTQIESGIRFNIFEIVKELRRQRHGMIQTKDQYLFCYHACLEALLSSQARQNSE
ncbi:hypothetical protein CHS0354_041851 [Potamilus streckersoni]|uniref:Tyrosine-protein phosphatase non-receptor type 13 n=1 Tax=Potamilus streckersoni TaxID=2493646 RepID=A0AAE0T175_9BIVA|nr:hypothetical protein CHS0354_041851 [Potamilus streckersoni]